MSATRLIHRAAARPHRMIADALQGLMVGELLSPGQRFLLISPWISDFPLLDNRSGRFSGLDTRWGAAWIPLSGVLRSLLGQQVRVQVACGSGPREDEFVDRLAKDAQRDGVDDLLTVRRSPDDPARVLDHEKALVADTWAVHGSMNMTYRGVEINGELVTITSEPSHVAALTTDLLGLFA
jgi:phosphatidylserine/phosphatidylglycerophosphate/cardiolipin synthase-like enzyme